MKQFTGGRKAVTLSAAAVSQDGMGRSVPCSVAKLADGPLISPHLMSSKCRGVIDRPMTNPGY